MASGEGPGRTARTDGRSLAAGRDTQAADPVRPDGPSGPAASHGRPGGPDQPAAPAPAPDGAGAESAATDSRPLPGWLEALAQAGSRWRVPLLGLAALVFIAAVGLALRDLLREVQYSAVLAAISSTPWGAILGAGVATAASFVALSGYDRAGLAYAGVRLPHGTVLMTSFIAYALGNTVGMGVLTGGAVRLRLYTAAGVEASKVGQAVAFNAMAFGLGLSSFGALGLLWGADEVAALTGSPAILLRGLALGMLLAMAWLLWACVHRPDLRLGRWTLRLPPLRLALEQLVVSAADLVTAGTALWLLLPAGTIGWPSFMVFYAIAIALAVISHVPGGLGVFEAVILLACGGRAPADAVLGALLLFRGVYYLLPLLLAAALLAGHELQRGVAAPVGRAAVRLSPMLMAALAFVAGVWLLFSGVTPSSDEAQQLLALHMPLPIVEASHFVGSIAGLGLLLVARGLLHRLDFAWWAALVLSVLAAVLALPKGIALSEFTLMVVLTLLLLMSRRQFDRPSSLVDQRLEPEWLLAVGVVLAATVWLLFFAYQDVAYAHQLWWQFEIDGQAPRSLRAVTAVAIAAALFAAWQLMSPPLRPLPPPDPEALDRAAAAMARDPNPAACLALMGDKPLLFSPSGRSFIMYGRQRRSWVALFDPVGDPAEFEELVWRFVELAASGGGRAVFYQVRAENLPLYLDAGMRVFKLGEYATVPLADFSLKGGARAKLRSGMNRGEREGLQFDWVEAAGVEALLPELREVSDGWLAGQRAREKGFSLGSFEPAYLCRLPMAVVRQSGRIVAFASLMTSATLEEASVDLMRHRPDVPNGTMDFLFARLMLHLKDAGYRHFGLGMAPMSGMAEHPLASRWQRYGRLVYEHGQRFYNFQGLRSFKEKFSPDWEARYLVAPGSTAGLLAMTDIAALIGGGLRGVVGR